MSLFEREGRADWIELRPSTNGGLVRMLRLKGRFRERPVHISEVQRDLNHMRSTDVTVIEVDGLDFSDQLVERMKSPNLWLLVATHPGRLKQWSPRLLSHTIFCLQNEEQLRTVLAIAEFYASL